jgi:hypothetical protein
MFPQSRIDDAGMPTCQRQQFLILRQPHARRLWMTEWNFQLWYLKSIAICAFA